MSLSIERPSSCRVVLTAEVPQTEVAEEREHVIKEVARKARIPGFRPGKAPRAIVERRFADEIQEELKEHLLHHTWDEVKAQATIRPASPLKVREAELRPDGSFRVDAELEVFPEVKLPSLDGFAPPEFPLEPTEDEQTEALERLRKRQASWEPVEAGVAEDGMLVEAEVNGTFPDGDGEPFHEERALIRLGGDETFPEIEAAIRGKKVGEEATAERIAEKHVEGSEEHQHARVAYHVKIKSLRRERLPELDDAFAASLGAEGGLAVLKERILEQLRVEKVKARVDVWRSSLLQHLAGEQPLELPETPINEGTREELIDFARTLAARGVDPEQAKVDWKKLEESMRGRVANRLRAELLFDALAEELEITVPAADIDHEVEREAARTNVPFGELKGNLAKSGGLIRLAAAMRRERAADQVLRPHFEGGTT